MLRRPVLAAIRAYRRSGGGRRWFGIDCNFEPTCSAYAEEAIRRFGLRPGIALARRRLRRCRARDSVCRCLEPVPAKHPDAEAGRG